jgi:hypothetical protein
MSDPDGNGYDMEKFPRGTIPPALFAAVQVTEVPVEVEPPPTTLANREGDAPAQAPRGTCDLASTCPNCGTLMQPEHAHYRCATCGYRDSCCF